MKTKMFAIILGMLLLSISSLQAKPKEEKKSSSVTEIIQKTINYPGFAQEQEIEGVVNMVVETNEKQEIKILQIWGSDQQLVKHVENKIAEQAVEKPQISDAKEGPKFVRIKFNIV